MSKLIREAFERHGEEIPCSDYDERTRGIAEALGACSVIRLNEDVTFKDIFLGVVPISGSTVVYDRYKRELDINELLAQI